mmetsp:Transcript_74037/g.197392  ORF Transcript_74037/g.197392 Transcript_74037/m.197392 type:complete len:204 (-) Transcript_74037:404-1015(-)
MVSIFCWSSMALRSAALCLPRLTPDCGLLAGRLLGLLFELEPLELALLLDFTLFNRGTFSISGSSANLTVRSAPPRFWSIQSQSPHWSPQSKLAFPSNFISSTIVAASVLGERGSLRKYLSPRLTTSPSGRTTSRCMTRSGPRADAIAPAASSVGDTCNAGITRPSTTFNGIIFFTASKAAARSSPAPRIDFNASDPPDSCTF